MEKLTRRAILRGAAPAALAAAAGTMIPSVASSAPGVSPTIAELFAEWGDIRAQVKARDRHMEAILATMPAEFRIGEGTPYRFPADFPADLRARYDAWHSANYPATWEDETDELSTTMADIEKEIAASPGQTLQDIAIKLWLHAHSIDCDYEAPYTDEEAYAEDGDLDYCLILSALRDAEHLSGGVRQGDAA